jgi:hypothetical protein
VQPFTEKCCKRRRDDSGGEGMTGHSDWGTVNHNGGKKNGFNQHDLRNITYEGLVRAVWEWKAPLI